MIARKRRSLQRAEGSDARGAACDCRPRDVGALGRIGCECLERDAVAAQVRERFAGVRLAPGTLYEAQTS